MKRLFLGALALALLLGIGYVLSLSPKEDRLWSSEFSRTSRAEAGEEAVTLRNVRDWTYGSGTVLSDEWIGEVVLAPKDVVRAWFVFEPFPSLPIAGHTYLTFEFSDGSAYSFSVEARREEGEKYSALSGLFRSYELAYTWGTERDFLTRRVMYLGHEVHLHELLVPEETAEALFVALARETEMLASSPRFYHTLTANCTNLLAKMANESGVATLPYDLAWNFPGFSEAYLSKEGLIALPGRVFLLPGALPEGGDAASFSRALRTP